jgi:hypothetical protein
MKIRGHLTARLNEVQIEFEKMVVWDREVVVCILIQASGISLDPFTTLERT